MSLYQHLGYKLTIYSFVLLVGFCTVSCARHQNTALVESPPTYQPTPSSKPEMKVPSFVGPKLPEVQEAVRRVFKESAVINPSAGASFFTGDFNGDACQDLAVILRPAPGKLSDLNEEYPVWLLRDPFLEGRQDRSSLTVAEHDLLLAIIHGYGENDWRDPQATQTFLLKNVVGENMTVKTARDFLAAQSGRKLPQAQGDLIGQTLRGTDGYIYYASANYSWYDPKTFKPKTNVGMIHGTR